MSLSARIYQMSYSAFPANLWVQITKSQTFENSQRLLLHVLALHGVVMNFLQAILSTNAWKFMEIWLETTESTSIWILFQKEWHLRLNCWRKYHTFASQSVSHCFTKFSGTGGKPRPRPMMMFNTPAWIGPCCHRERRQETLATTFEGFKAVLEHLNPTQKESMATVQLKTVKPNLVAEMAHPLSNYQP